MLATIGEQAAELCRKYRCELLEFNGETDDVHLLASCHPTVSVSQLVSSLKTVTSRRVRKDFGEYLRKFYWKPFFWSASYAAFSVGSATVDTVKNYILNQEQPQH